MGRVIGYRIDRTLAPVTVANGQTVKQIRAVGTLLLLHKVWFFLNFNESTQFRENSW